MPPRLASVLTLVFVFWLFRRDFRDETKASRALWIPFLWLTFNMSRPVSSWLSMVGVSVSGSLEGGSPVDMVFYLSLIVMGGYVLASRHVSLGLLIQNNFWILLYLAYCFVSVMWTDNVFLAFKRWIKVLGHPIMMLVILTEPNPQEAIIRVIKRCAYVLVPVSVLFVKYYPEWGKSFSEWTGEPMTNGIALGKNALGVDCLILGFILLWHFVLTWRNKSIEQKSRREELCLWAFFLYLIGWLLYLANSKTPLIALVVAVAVFVLAGKLRFQREHIGTCLLGIALLVFGAEMAFGVYEGTLRLLGRDPTLTDRTYVWRDVLAMAGNPVVGTGFESFWTGERLEKLWAKHTWRPNQAHNGYIEMYVNLGMIGCVLFGTMLASAFVKARAEYLRNFELGRMRLGFLLAVMAYNWTEASFKALHPVWTIFYLLTLDYPVRQSKQRPVPSTEPDRRNDYQTVMGVPQYADHP